MNETSDIKNNKKKSQDSNRTEAELARGEAAFERILPRMAALADTELAATTTNITEGALAAIGVAAEVIKADIRVQFESLPSTHFDMAHVDDLQYLAWGTLHASLMADQARYVQSRARVPADVIAEATAIEKRMQACCEYHLSDHPTAGPELMRLRPGQGYRDLAYDLLGYSALQEEHRALLEGDKKHYRASDRADAIRLGEQIFAIIGYSHTEQIQSATAQLHRAWTLLLRSYGEVREAGRWLFRHDTATVERLFPSLFAVGRTGRPRRREHEPAAPPAAPDTPDLLLS